MRAAAVSLVAFALFAALASGAPRAASSEAERQARHAFQEGEADFRAGRYAEALDQYQAGYDQLPLPGFLINIAQCQRRLGDLRKARATYQKFMMVAPDSPHVSEVQTLIAELDKLIADLDADRPAPASDPVPAAAAAPAVLPLSLSPAVPAAEAAPPPGLLATPPPSLAPPPHHRWWLWTLVGAAVVGAGAAAAAIVFSPDTTTIHEGSLATLRR